MSAGPYLPVDPVPSLFKNSPKDCVSSSCSFRVGGWMVGTVSQPPMILSCSACGVFRQNGTFVIGRCGTAMHTITFLRVTCIIVHETAELGRFPRIEVYAFEGGLASDAACRRQVIVALRLTCLCSRCRMHRIAASLQSQGIGLSDRLVLICGYAPIRPSIGGTNLSVARLLMYRVRRKLGKAIWVYLVAYICRELYGTQLNDR